MNEQTINRFYSFTKAYCFICKGNEFPRKQNSEHTNNNNNNKKKNGDSDSNDK